MRTEEIPIMPSTIEIITGCMYSGKSEEVIKRLKRTGYIKKKILVGKPPDDNRKERNIFNMIASDSYLSKYKGLVTSFIDSLGGLRLILQEAENMGEPFEVLALDECQFFGSWLVDAVKEIRDQSNGMIIILSGLVKDFLDNDFGPLPGLLSSVEDITVLTANCHKCEKRPATMTYKIGGSPNQQKEPGGKGIYEARCRSCHKLPE